MNILLRYIGICIVIVTICACGKTISQIPESSETIKNWQIAREYQEQKRYELAKQYYLLALATSRDREVQEVLKQEIKAIDRIIQITR